jgi:cytochrome P450
VRSAKYSSAFVPLSEGVRACFGQRFAEVEMVVAVAKLFSQYNVEIVQLFGKSESAAIKGLKVVVARGTN